ncbi:MAG: prolipoprotein diacylglyceryl transferase family protein [Acidobacteriota bacterium]
MRAINDFLDNLVRTEVHLPHLAIPAFQVCGYIGLAMATLLTMFLVSNLNLSPLVMAIIILVAIVTFLGLVMATKIVTGVERIVYYHHEIAVLLVTAILLWLLGKPTLVYLDVTILGIGLFLVCGRIGCLMVGCCHGRPYHFGVCYKQEHAIVGFTNYYVGIRLFPIQAVESLWVLSVVVIGIVITLSSHISGSTLAWYIVAYDLGRFCFEFMRGDPERPYYLEFSQPQWLSLLLICLVAVAELTGVLPFQIWHILAMGCLAIAMLIIVLKRRLQSINKDKLLHPHHVKEVAKAIETISASIAEKRSTYTWTVFPRENSNTMDIEVFCTSLGVQISAGKIYGPLETIDHFTLSYRDGNMTESIARPLAQLILQLKQATGSSQLLRGNQGVFHLLIQP